MLLNDDRRNLGVFAVFHLIVDFHLLAEIVRRKSEASVSNGLFVFAVQQPNVCPMNALHCSKAIKEYANCTRIMSADYADDSAGFSGWSAYPSFPQLAQAHTVA